MTTNEPTRGLTTEQLRVLFRPIAPNRVKLHNNKPHLEAWDVRRWLTRIFGFAGWSDEIMELKCVHEQVWPYMDKGSPVPGKSRATVVYRVTMRLHIMDVHGNELRYCDDGATGEGVNQASVGAAHDLAMKSAISQALKRCAANLGDQFGLSLYSDVAYMEPVLRWSAAHLPPQEAAPETQDAPVTGGELEEELGEQPTTLAVGEHAADRALADAGSNNGHFVAAKPLAQDPWTSDAPAARMATKPQQGMIASLFQRKLGMDREARLAALTEWLGVPITSGGDLTFEQAQECIKRFEKIEAPA